MPRSLRCITYLAPGLPAELFAGVARFLGRRLGRTPSLRIESSTSGPPRGTQDPFQSGEVDIGWMCTPSYFWLREARPVCGSLVPCAMLFADERNQGRPSYFSDVVVQRRSAVESFLDLRGGRWVFNDLSSQSGYYNLLQELSALGEDLNFFSSVVQTGSHLNSLHQVAANGADAAAIDSNVLAHHLERDPSLRSSIRVLTSWGPHTMQPLVAGTRLGSALVDDIAGALLSMHDDERGAHLLEQFNVLRFLEVDEASYRSERTALRCSEALLHRSCDHSLTGVPLRTGK